MSRREFMVWLFITDVMLIAAGIMMGIAIGKS